MLGRPWLVPLVLAATTACGRLAFTTTDADLLEVPPGDADLLPEVPPGCTGPDEDGDGWPNACDNCPTEPNPDQRDRGELDAGNPADGVGDACDPRPTLAGDYIALFEPHDVPGDYQHGGTWSYPGNGTLRLGDTDDNGSASFTTPTSITRIDLRFDIVAAATAGTTWFGVWSERDAIFANGRDVIGDVPPGNFVLKEQSDTGDRYSPDIPGPAAFVPGERYRLIDDVDDSGLRTLRVFDVFNNTAGTTSLAMTISRGDRGYLEAHLTGIEIHYLIVYAR
jgi:hypothetical protein